MFTDLFILAKLENEKATKIREIADQYRISFKEAEFIYPLVVENYTEDIINGARNIYRIMEEYRVPENIASYITWQDNINNIDIGDICFSISHYVEHIEYNEMGLGYQYAKKLYQLISNGIPLKKAEEIIELKNKIISKITNRPIELVSVMNIDNIDKELAQTMLDIYYFTRYDDPFYLGDYCQMTKNYLLNSDKLKGDYVNGIIIKSKTDEGLANLKRMVISAFNKGNNDFTEKLYNEATKHNLVVTDIKLNSDKSSYFYARANYIYISEFDLIDYNNEETLYHEATHFLDYISGNEDKYYSICTERFNELFKQIKKELNNASTNSIINNNFIPNFIKREIQNNPDGFNIGMISTIMKHKFNQNKKSGLDYINNKELREKWKKEIDRKYLYDSRADRELYFEQKIYYERQKYLRLVSCIQDIYDGLTTGKVHDWFKLSGHGIKYYSEIENQVIEFIALIGEIYNADGVDVLEYELGKELTKEIINIYKEFIKYGNEENKEIEHVNGITK